MDDLLSEFLTETSESITTLDVELVHLEQNPDDPGILSNIFRLVHTIKGTCGFLGLPRLEKLAHAGENVMSKFRDGELKVSPDAVTLILNSIDRIKEILTYIEDNEVEPEGDDLDLINPLNTMADGGTVDMSQPAPAAEPEAPVEEPAAEETPATDEAPTEEANTSSPKTSDDGFPVAAELLAEVEQAISQGKKAASQEEIEAEMEAERKAEAPLKSTAPAKVSDSKGVAESGQLKARESSVAAQSIRVNVELLENLMTLVSELVLTRNQLLQMVRGHDDSEFTAPLQRLSHITTDLQEGVMKTRMQPIGNAWAKLPRIVRDLSIETGKKIDLQMHGAETELDRQILELIRDPLTHMVRNSADHGLEDVQERLAVGKTETGIIRLDAYHEGGHIIVEIADDGRGLNIERIREKAILNGLASDAEMEAMSEQQIAQYIFRAGFSTAEKVTSVSGRGVGMDVVKTNIEQIGGTVELKTKTGKGSTFVIKIPLTLAIVSALIVAAGGERFAIPQISVVELVRVTQKSEQAIEMINNSPVLRLRDRLLPLVNLTELLKLEEQEKEENELVDQDAEETFIVISQVGTYTFGIIVDRVFDTEEIVVKPVAPILRDITMFSGNTILGDGSVIMILDPNGIASATGESSENQGEIEEERAKEATDSEDKTSLLIFRANSTDLKAVPLGLVARLEEIDIEKVEHSYGKPVVQYRGQLMPLISVDFSYDLRTEGRQPILVFSDADRSMGLVVDEIVDIVEDKLKVELKADVEGLIGTAVVNGKATDVIDTGYYLTQAFGDWFGNHSTGADGGHSMLNSKKLLLVDDSAFFRNLMTPLLSLEGYHVTTVNGPSEALALREDGEMFDIIVSDIEMPDMNGFDFAKEVRNEKQWKDCILIALSSHATEEDFARGREVGFDEYVSKFDRDMLVQILKDLVKQEAFKPRESQNA